MGRPKGSGKKHTEDAQESVHGKNTAVATPDTVKAPEAPVLPPAQALEIAPFDTCRYSEEFPDGRMFKKGEPIPPEFVDTPAKLKKRG